MAGYSGPSAGGTALAEAFPGIEYVRVRSLAAIQDAVDALTEGGDIVLPSGIIDVNGTIVAPTVTGQLGYKWNFVGKNTILKTNVAAPIIGDTLPPFNDGPGGATDRCTNRAFSFTGIKFLGTKAIGQVGIKLFGSYMTEISRCVFSGLEDGYDLVFCMNTVTDSNIFHDCLNHHERFRLGMDVDNGNGTKTPLWPGAAETNSNGNCPKSRANRHFGGQPLAQMTIINKQIVANVATLQTSAPLPAGMVAGRWVLVRGLGAPYDGAWKMTAVTADTFSYNRTGAEASTPVAGTPRVVTDATIAVANPTLSSATAAFTDLDRGATVEHPNYPGGITTITTIVSPTQAFTASGASGALAGQTVTITRKTTAQCAPRAQIVYEGISEIVVDGPINEGFPPIDDVVYDQCGSTTSKGLVFRDAHPEIQPLNSHFRLIGTGGGQVIIEGGSWTQAGDTAILMDTSAFTTGIMHWHNQSGVAGKFRDKANSQVVWCFDSFGAAGEDPTLATKWDGPVPLYFLPIRRTATAADGAGLGNSGVLAYKGDGLTSSTGSHNAASTDVSPKITFRTSRGPRIGMWSAAAHPDTLITDSLSFWNDNVNGRLVLYLKNGAGTVFSIPISHLLPGLLAGTGTPEGSKVAPVGSVYMRTDGGAGTTFYVKETGAGNTGWVAK